MKTLIILPTQLFEDNKLLEIVDNIFIIEEPLYFTSLPFHKQKLVLHRASMQYYKDSIKKYKPVYIEYNKVNKTFYNKIKKESTEVLIYDPVDEPLIKLYNSIFKDKIKYYDTPSFMETRKELDDYRENNTNKKNYYHDNSFYRWQRKKLNLLMKGNNPLYDKWSFDKENRNKYDKDYKESKLTEYTNDYITEAKEYIITHFEKNFGLIDNFIYPITHVEAKKHFKLFLNKKLDTFGKFQDGVNDSVILGSHSNISAILNIGLITPDYIIKETIKTVGNTPKKEIIASVEGFLRQVIGWRSFVRFVYIYHHKDMPKENYFNHKNKLSNNWYKASTNIPIIDDLIKKAEKYAYLHHIERLMYMGNFALITEIKPTEIYKWFMICFIDSYQWVMMPNVYAMSQYSTTSFTMMTRPYFSSTNYIKKMSNYKDSKITINNKNYSWFDIWNGLYYKFINDNKEKLKKIYAIAMQVKYWNNMNTVNKSSHINLASLYNKYY